MKGFGEDIGGVIGQRNATRYEPYPYLVPSLIPQSINIRAFVPG
ncbi:hypothetical protein KH5H1_58790 [Corallococcus caeni]|nr:hypothetical protein KH5H1_58790 [Corallococcus sp. KH5-1]